MPKDRMRRLFDARSSELSWKIVCRALKSSLFTERVQDRLGIDPKKTVGVFGDFSICWPYIDYICRTVVGFGFAALTSRYIYSEDSKGQPSLRNTFRRNDPLFMPFKEDLSEKDFIKIVTAFAAKGLIVESVPSSAFYETEALFDQRKEVLGIVFVYESSKSRNCRKLAVSKEPGGIAYSSCADDTGECLDGFCPFRGLRHTIRDMYTRRKEMTLVALESLYTLKQAMSDLKFL